MVLEVRVVSAATGGLRIIDHIPSVRPCRLEGRNGIGKSALVRVLMLVSGEQPYPGETASWRSLRTLIGPTTITINGLNGEHSSAMVRLTPERWPAQPVTNIEDWVGVLTFDDKEAPIEELFSIFHVVHLSGTERLADTLTQQTGRLAVVLSRVSERLDALNDRRAELGELAEDLRFASPREVEAEQHRLRAKASERGEVARHIGEFRPRVEELARASALTALVEGGGAAEHEEKLTALRDGLHEARMRMTSAERAHNAAVAALAKGTTAQREIAKRERRLGTLKKNEDRLLARQEELAARIEALGIPATTELLDDPQGVVLEEAAALSTRLQKKLQVLAARNHRTAAENRLLDDVRIVLDDAVRDGLRDTVLARIKELNVTVGELREGLGFLEEVDVSEMDDLATATRDLAELSEVRDLFDKRAALRAERDQLREELRELEPDATGHDELRVKATEAREALDEAASEVHSYNAQIGAMSRSVLGSTEVIDVEKAISDLLTKHDVAPLDLPAALVEAQTEAMTLQTREEDLTRELELLTANGTRRRLNREALRRDSESAAPQWRLHELASTLEPALPTDEGADWPDHVWQLLADHVSASKDALDRLVNDISGLSALAAGSASRLQTGRMGGALRAVVEAEALAELSARPIAEALFDGGQVLRVNLDEDSSTITWTTPADEVRTRPMSAFSSGEQALGFMRARLQQIADQPSSNRLVFLDEFGAFISADRRRPLAELLTSDELKALAEQVVVVLPLQSDYASELSETTGALHAIYERRAVEVEEHGYFTEAFNG